MMRRAIGWEEYNNYFLFTAPYSLFSYIIPPPIHPARNGMAHKAAILSFSPVGMNTDRHYTPSASD
jgi:hypothetical protein